MPVEVDRQRHLDAVEKKPHAAMDMLDVLRQAVSLRAATGPCARGAEPERDDRIGGDLRRARVADMVAGFGGSWTFIILVPARPGESTLLANVASGGGRRDPYPFILLNLIPVDAWRRCRRRVIMMSQIRQDTKDRLRGEPRFRGQSPRRVGSQDCRAS